MKLVSINNLSTLYRNNYTNLSTQRQCSSPAIKTLSADTVSFGSIDSDVKNIDISGNFLLDKNNNLHAADIKISAADFENPKMHLNGTFTTLANSMVSANNLSVEGDANFAGSVALKEKFTTDSNVFIGKNALMVADEANAKGTLRVGGELCVNNLKTKSLVASRSSQFSVNNSNVTEDVIFNGQSSIKDKITVGGNLSVNKHSTFAAKEAEVAGDAFLYGSTNISSLATKGNVKISELSNANTIDEILLVPAKSKVNNLERQITFLSPLKNLKNMINIGYDVSYNLVIYSNEEPKELLRKLRFNRAKVSTLDSGEKVYRLGKLIIPKKMDELFKLGKIVVKQL